MVIDTVVPYITFEPNDFKWAERLKKEDNEDEDEGT
jgi:hypothetical protein